VLVNLLHNAIKFTPEGGTIIASARASENQVILSVEDTGVGIPSEDLLRIFERFYKSDRSRSSTGTGLGLAIARHLVEAHGGNIWVESSEAEGSIFSFSIPLAHP
jgi:two-component system phosphate regulon sensor histidine kinase PhoR